MSSLSRPSLLAFAGTAAGMLVYESTKQWIFPQITIWQSHAMTIAVSAIVATIAVRRALRANERLQRDAYYDRLTGLLNRNGFMDLLEKSRHQAKTDSSRDFALLFLDSDRFKSVNDTWGHSAGDLLIRALAERISDQLAPGDVVARFGGDEFTIVLYGVNDPARAMAVADQIRRAVEAPVEVRGEEIFTSISIGVAMCDPAYDHAEEIVRDADLAMYRAKTLGRGRAQLFLPSMRVALMRRLSLERDLVRAVERGEMRVIYQPIIELATGEIAGFEALLRWHHPIHNLIPPAEFIPLAEESDVIRDIGEFVLREACAQGATWMEMHPDRPPTMSVNVSPRQLQHADLAQLVATLLRETGLRPQLLNVEITESVLQHDGAELAIEELTGLGVDIHLDDFGAGHSSLARLDQFPISTLKIDKYFIRRFSEGADGVELVRTILEMATTLGLDVVAEGVETREQESALRAMGCRYAQGYLFSPAVPAADASDQLNEPVRSALQIA